MVFTTQCPQCGKILWFSGKRAGSMTVCPACGGVMRLPTPPPPPAPAPTDVAPDAREIPLAPEVEMAPEPAAVPLPQPAPDAEGAGNQAAAAAQRQPIEPTPAVAPPAPAQPAQIPAPQPMNAPPAGYGSPLEGLAAALANVQADEGDEESHVPAAVEASYLTHQAAAAAGETHVDLPASQIAQSPPPPPQRVAPPVWAPASVAPPPRPTSGWTVAPASAPQSMSQPMPVSAAPFAQAVQARRRARGVPVLAWAAGAVAVVIVVIVLLWLAGGQSPNLVWEQTHRDDILLLKQDAENLAINGKPREAYDKYQELERLVAGHPISDEYLKSELEKAWQRRDELYDRAIGVGVGPGKSASASSRPTPGAQSNAAPAAPGPEASPKPSAPLASSAPAIPKPVAAQVVLPPARPPRPPVKAVPVVQTGITDEQLGDAIHRGASYLLKQFSGPELPQDTTFHDGLDSLVVYALMQCELATSDRRLDPHGPLMNDMIEAMKLLPVATDRSDPVNPCTYTHALRATALALFDRPQDHGKLREDVTWLVNAEYEGAYTYDNNFTHDIRSFFWDNSNSQYGLLGVWAGAEDGIQVRPDYWKDIEQHWTSCQMVDGQWSYHANDDEPRQSMTLAGIASLYVAQDYLDNEEWGDKVGRPPFSPALAKGLDWLETADNSVIAPSNMYSYYTIYGLERVGLASGFKFFGSHDWYREGAASLMQTQSPDGSWGGEGWEQLVDSSYALLFLARGRHPLLMNKVRFDGDWANRPRDLANLAKFATEELERPLNWQVVSIANNWTQWMDSPILYLASDQPPPLSERDEQQILDYIDAGGLLLAQADGDSPSFTKYVTDLGERLFPQYKWTDLPTDSPIWSISYRIAERPPVRVISNGSRILMMLWPTDISHYWQLRQEKEGRWAYELGVNLALYAAGKGELRNRVESDVIPAPSTRPSAVLPVARLRYAGNWNPEPDAWPRFENWFTQNTSLGVAPQPISIDSLSRQNPPLAELTGTARFSASPEELASITNYVQGGGVLLIDPCGMPGEFLAGIRDELLPRAFPTSELEPMDPSFPMLTSSGNGMEDVSSPEIREFARSLPDITQTRPQILTSGKGYVIVLPLDIQSGMLGLHTWGIAGYRPEYSLSLMKNIVLWAWDGAKGA